MYKSNYCFEKKKKKRPISPSAFDINIFHCVLPIFKKILGSLDEPNSCALTTEQYSATPRPRSPRTFLSVC